MTKRPGWPPKIKLRSVLVTTVTVAIVAVCLLLQTDAWSEDRLAAPETAKTIPAFSSPNTHGEVGDARRASATIKKLKPLHKILGKPKPGEWLDQHEEPGQSFEQYYESRAVTPTGTRTVIYVQPLGAFTEQERQIIDLSAEYLGIYMNRPVRILHDLPDSVVPDEARRVHPQWGVKQILTTYVLDDVLKPRLPDDAAAYIAFTATDLWPGRGWNFVFGQASLRDRVGVWSLNRNGDPAEDDAAFLLCLRRTLKTATHETGHMFSLQHCTAYECNMCGANHREESDRHPLHLCPECHAKVCWATAADPIARYRKLAEFCAKHGLEAEQAFFEQARKALSE